MLSANSAQRLSLLVVFLTSLLLTALPAQAQTADDLANDAFAATYEANPALWGTPGPTLSEVYHNSPDGEREVQYFDKGRMELTYPDIQPNFVGDGKLVVELISGRVQIADTVYLQYDGAEMPIAGGKTFAANPAAPSYRAFQSLVGTDPSRVGRPVSAVLTAPQDEGYFLGFYSLNSDTALGTLSRYATYIKESGHNIPDVFLTYLNQSDANGLPAFNWQTVFGLPITDAYWAKVRDGNTVSDILVQLYERRTLLYNPAKPTGQQIESGNVGSDYYQWRYERPELSVFDNTVLPPFTSPNAKVTPAVGEAGTAFKLEAGGFAADEFVDVYARLQKDGGVYSLDSFRADGKGQITRFLRTRPLEFATEEIYYVLTGQSSGVTALWNIKVIGSTRYTPGVEANEPTDVPPGQLASIDKQVISIGETANIFAIGFQPGEFLRGWVTTPLNRVVGWVGLVNSNSTLDFYSYTLQADKQGQFRLKMPAPGTALPGIYAFTLYGTQSNKTAVVYFRVRTGPAVIFDPQWGRFDFEPTDELEPAIPVDAPAKKVQSVDVTKLTQYHDRYRMRLISLTEAK